MSIYTWTRNRRLWPHQILNTHTKTGQQVNEGKSHRPTVLSLRPTRLPTPPPFPPPSTTTLNMQTYTHKLPQHSAGVLLSFPITDLVVALRLLHEELQTSVSLKLAETYAAQYTKGSIRRISSPLCQELHDLPPTSTLKANSKSVYLIRGARHWAERGRERGKSGFERQRGMGRDRRRRGRRETGRENRRERGRDRGR